MKKHVVTITGLPGSGKSSTANEVARVLGYARFSGGDFWRQVAKEQGLSVEELNARAEKDTSVDALIDDAVRRAGERSNVVIDSRLAFHWIPESFKVFLKIDTRTAAERTYAHIVGEGRESQSATSVEDVFEKTAARIKSENQRYALLYGISYLDESQYDLVVDTTKHPLAEVAGIVTAAYRAWLEA